MKVVGLRGDTVTPPSPLRTSGKFVGLALTLLLVAIACGGDAAVRPGQAVVSTIPWVVPETARYRILDSDDIKGSGVLSIEARGDALIFSQSFQSQEQAFTDDISVETDATTLQPLTVRRVIAGPEGERVCDANYAGGVAVVTQRARDDERIDRLDVPAPSYDSWTDLFLWRTLPFEQGYEATYTDILTCSLAKPGVLSVEIKVTALETVSVPAGSFQAWRLEIRSGGLTQKAWYADDEARTLVRYDNGNEVFELESVH